MKCKLSQHADEKQRIPQNVMSTVSSKVKWVLGDIVLHYRVSNRMLIQGKFALKAPLALSTYGSNSNNINADWVKFFMTRDRIGK